MLKDPLSRLAVALILLIIFFAVLTQRILLSTSDSSGLETVRFPQFSVTGNSSSHYLVRNVQSAAITGQSEDAVKNNNGNELEILKNKLKSLEAEMNRLREENQLLRVGKGLTTFASNASILGFEDPHIEPSHLEPSTNLTLPPKPPIKDFAQLNSVLPHAPKVADLIGQVGVGIATSVEPLGTLDVAPQEVRYSSTSPRKGKRRHKRPVDDLLATKPRRHERDVQGMLGGLDSLSMPKPRPNPGVGVDADPANVLGLGSLDAMNTPVKRVPAVTHTPPSKPLLEPDDTPPHPFLSPRTGTDISDMHQLAILKCVNQTKCVVPELQLKVVLKVYLCKHPTKSGIRFYFLAREAFLLHPNVIMLEEHDIALADFIVYLPGSAPWHLTECTNRSYADKLIVLDEFDGFTRFHPENTLEKMKEVYGEQMVWYFMYFKRSFVARMDGKFLRYPHVDSFETYPMTYAIAEAYVQHRFNFVREIEILCTLRGSLKMITRLRVQEWIAEYVADRRVENAVTSQVNTASRGSVSTQYFEQMYNSKIIVTVNPAHWEGDFRLWEAFATGALIMVDPIFVPHNYPLIDGKHVVYFSNANKTDLFEKLDYYRAHPEKARKIAIAGYLYTMKHHRTVNLADYVLRSAHLRRASLQAAHPLPRYEYTAQYLNAETKRQRESIKKRNFPGVYSPIVMANHTHMEGG